MCYRPLHIRCDSNGKIANEVPCGKCSSCKRQKINDYTVRAYQDFVNYNNNCFFATLTYDNDHLPFVTEYPDNPIFKSIFDVPEHERESYYFNDILDDDFVFNFPRRFSCWNKSHVQQFLKKLNEHAQYDIITKYLNIPRLITSNGHRIVNPNFKDSLKTIGRPFRYLVTCERGKSDIYVADNGRTRRGTARPHYHCIIMSTHKYITSQWIENAIKKYWTFGLVYNILIDREETPTSAVSYVTKYVVKDLNEQANNVLYASHEQFLNCRPFTLISNDFGGSWLRSLPHDVDKVLDFFDSGIPLCNKNGSQTSFNIPSYYSNKLLKRNIKKLVIDSPNHVHVKVSDVTETIYPDKIYGYNFIDFEVFSDVVQRTEYTPLGIEVTKKLHANMVKYYTDCLVILNNLKPISKYLQLDKIDVNINKFSEYIDIVRNIQYDANDIYRHINKPHLDFWTQFETAYLEIKRFMSHLSEEKDLKFQIDYQNSLLTSFYNNPKLFNRFPI